MLLYGTSCLPYILKEAWETPSWLGWLGTSMSRYESLQVMLPAGAATIKPHTYRTVSSPEYTRAGSHTLTWA